MKTPKQSQLIIEAHRKDLETARYAVEFWKVRVNDLEAGLESATEHAGAVDRLADEEEQAKLTKKPKSRLRK